MATRLKEVDAVMVGMGWTGSILARELTKAGPARWSGLSAARTSSRAKISRMPHIRDELRYVQRLDHDPGSGDGDADRSGTGRRESALPMRRMGSFLPGNGVGGAANHWGGQHWRYLPSDHLTRSHIVNRYGAKAIPEDMTIQDWAMTYDELEPYYDRFDKLCGVSGKAGNLRGQKIDGGNVFEGPRSNEYPTPPVKMTESALMYEKACRGARLSSVSAAGLDDAASPTPTARGSRSAAASIAATANAPAARPTPRPARMSACCRCCAPIRSSSCARAPG